MRILAYFLLLPLIELALFIYAGSEIGFWPTVGLTLATTLLGMAVLRRQKARAMAGLRQAEAIPEQAAAPLAALALRQVGGMLLVLPGFLTDVAGLLLLVPPVQTLLLRKLSGRLRGMVAGIGPGGQAGFSAGFGTTFRAGFGPAPLRPDVVIEGEAVEIVDPADPHAPTALPGTPPEAAGPEAAPRKGADRRPPSGWTRDGIDG